MEWEVPKKTAKRPSSDCASADLPATKNKYAGLQEVIFPSPVNISNKNKNTPKKSRIPPICMMPCGSHAATLALIKTAVKESFAVKYKNNKSVSVQCTNETDFCALKEHLRCSEVNQPFYTYTPASERLIKSVIRGLPKIETDEIKEDLLSQGFQVVKVSPLGNSRLYLVLFGTNTKISDVKSIKQISCCRVTMEKLIKSTGCTQCFRCQQFGHAATNCNFPARCVKCTGEHHTHMCTKEGRSTPAKCCNCGGDHPANFRDCPARVSHESNLEKSKTFHRPTATRRFNSNKVVEGKSWSSLLKPSPDVSAPAPSTASAPHAGPQRSAFPQPSSNSEPSAAGLLPILKAIIAVRSKLANCVDNLEKAMIIVELLDALDG